MTFILPKVEHPPIPLEWQAFDQTYDRDYPGANGDFTSQYEVGAVLGPGDPEMDACARRLWRMGIPFVNARAEESRRPYPHEAYSTQFNETVLSFGQVATIECAMLDFTPDHEIDHHGDRKPKGADRSLEFAYEKSSIGQLNEWLARETGQTVTPTRTEVVIGAIDEAAGPVLNDQHPYIRAGEATYVMVREIVRGARKELNPSQRSIDEVQANVNYWVRHLDEATPKKVYGTDVVDLRGIYHPGVGYSEGTLIIKTAGAIAGKAVWIQTSEFGNPDCQKESFTGLVTEGHVDAFEKVATDQDMEIALTDRDRGIAIARRRIETSIQDA